MNPRTGTIQAQDLEFVIEEVPHDRFQRDGDTLRLSVQISLADALCGFTTTIKTLDGRTLRISNPTVIRPAHEIRVQGEGMPNSKTGQKGDLILVCQVDIPRVGARLSEDEKAQVRSALAALGG